MHKVYILVSSIILIGSTEVAVINKKREKKENDSPSF